MFEDSLLHADQQAHRFWQQYPAVLDAVTTSRLGLPCGDAGCRERAVQELQRPLHAWIEAGALFRVMMESRYRRTRHWLRGLGVEILTPSRSEFVIGDIPALTVRKGMPSAGVNSGIGYAFADAIILPINAAPLEDATVMIESVSAQGAGGCPGIRMPLGQGGILAHDHAVLSGTRCR